MSGHQNWFKGRGRYRPPYNNRGRHPGQFQNRSVIRNEAGILISVGGDSDLGDTSPPGSGCFNRPRRYDVRGNNHAVQQSGRAPRGVFQKIRQIITPNAGARNDARSGGTSIMTASQSQLPPWTKITIVNGSKYGREFILKSLNAYVDSELKPLNYFQNVDVTFMLEDNELAESVSSASRRISTPSGEKLVIRGVQVPCPFVPLPADRIELLKVVLEKRYDHAKRHFDLSNFMHDPDFKTREVYDMALTRISVMYALVKLIGESCPQVVSLDLSSNRLRNLDYFANLIPSAPNVSRLILFENLIDLDRELEKLSPWPITEIVLDKNPLCSTFHDKPRYISTMRKYFPKIARLDNVDLPVLPGFGDLDFKEDDKIASKLPPFKDGFFVGNAETDGLIKVFVEQFYTVYDSEDRQKLLEAYDDNATFTLTAQVLQMDAPHRKSNLFATYIRESHNIKNMEFWERHRTRIVRRGKLSVVSCLQELPRTEHDPTSFVIDVSFCCDSLLCFSVSGLFREVDEEKTIPDKFFTRVFLVVPFGAGMVIVNEELFITLRSVEQNKAYRTLLQRARAPDVVPGSSSQPQATGIDQSQASANHILAAVTSASSHEQMIESFERDSGMKRDWAAKCLEENEWDYARASTTFLQLKANNSIPAMAFN